LERSGAFLEEDRDVGFRDCDGAEEPEGAGEEGHDAFIPSPADGLADEAADDGAELGEEVRIPFDRGFREKREVELTVGPIKGAAEKTDIARPR